MSEKEIPYKIYLEESEMPKQWYNVRADMKNKPAPLLNPATLKPMTAKELGHVGKPILLKRGMSATMRDLLMAAEYIMAGGNDDVILCERGIRTYETYTRNTLDLSAVAAVKHLSHLPIIVDPSHGTGKWRMVKPMAFAAIAAGADGLMMEVHPNPAKALSDGPQSLTPENYNEVMRGVQKISAFMKAEKISSMDI